MLFEQIRHGGCLSYLIGCEETRSAMVVDPELDQIDRYLALAAEKGLRIRYVARHAHPRGSFHGGARARRASSRCRS